MACGGVLQELEVADGADIVEPVVFPQRKAGRVVTAIFEALEPLHEERPAVTFADVSDDPAHTKTSLENAESPAIATTSTSRRSAELLLY